MKDGILNKNPLFRLALGICPAIAVTTYAANALGIGIITCCVLICTSIVCALLGKAVSEAGRVPAFLMVTALFATVAQLIVKACFPGLADALGIFLPLVAVNCLLLSRADYAAEHGIGPAVTDAVGMGLGYVCAITIVGIVREFLAYGSIFGANILNTYSPVVLATLPAGGFLILGLLMGIFNAILGKKADEEETEA